MVDTQADISLIKCKSLNPFTQFDPCRKVNIFGVTDGVTQSLGVTHTSLVCKSIVLAHSFHVVKDGFPIETDGILGRDFIKKFLCNLDYRDMIFTIRTSIGCISVPIESSVSTKLVLSPRCEIVTSVRLKNKFSEDQLVEAQELKPGVVVARTIISHKNPILRILNTTSKEVIINKPLELSTKNISDFNAFAFEGRSETRANDVLKVLSRGFPNYAPKGLTDVCKEFSDVFILPEERLTTNNFYSQKFRIIDDTPTYIKNYRLPYSQKEEINSQVRKMLEDQIVEPCASNYNSPVILVPKKSTDGNKKWRLCIDYRQVNKKLVSDKYPLGRIDDILDQLGRARYFSVLDLFSGFHQIPLDPESRDITSFSTDFGSFRFKVLPFGLKVAPNSFSRMMNLAFSGLEPSTSFLYLDDIIVIGVSESHHIANLKKVFETCRKHNLKLNPNKCQFMKSEVTYLGHKCTDRGIYPDNSKFNVIRDYPLPKDKDAVKRFVAFCNYYRRFIPLFADLAHPLNKLTQKKANFVWSNECQKSFDKLKNSLLSPRILQYPDFKKQFIITVDAAKYGMGAVLSQIKEGQDLPISFASKSFTKGEMNKSTIEKELCALHWAIKFFRPYVYGVKFVVRSDHKPLQYLFSLRDPTSKLSRMRMDLSEYDFVVEYLKGKDNVLADALSRVDFEYFKQLLSENTTILKMTTRSIGKENSALAVQSIPNNIELDLKAFEVSNNNDLLNVPSLRFNITQQKSNLRIQCSINKGCKTVKNFDLIIPFANGNVFLEKIFSRLNVEAGKRSIEMVKISLRDGIFDYFSVSDFKEMANRILKNVKIAIMRLVTLVRSKEERKKILERFHNDPVEGGHCGQKRLYLKLKNFFYWEGMRKDAISFVRECKECLLNKPRLLNVEPLMKTHTPQKAFDLVIIDTIGPFETSLNGNKYAVTLICDLTKFLIILPVKDKEAKTIARAVFDGFILRYGGMREIRTDMGTEYINQTLAELTKLLNIKHMRSSSYHHQSLGTIERSHKTLNEYLRSYLKESRYNWDEFATYFGYCYNTTPNIVAANYTPFELVFGKLSPRLELLNSSSVEPVYNVDDYSKEVKYRLQVAQKRAHNCIELFKTKYKMDYDRKAKPLNLKVGDRVLLRNENRHKLDKMYLGPYVVVSIKDPNVELNYTNSSCKNKLITVHKNRLSKCK